VYPLGSAIPRRLGRAGLITILLACAPSVSFAEDGERGPSVANGSDPSAIDEPAFPGTTLREGVRIWTGSYFVPPTDFGQVDLSLARPELRVRFRLPVNGVANIQLTGDFRPSFYDTSGSGRLFEDCAACPSPDDLYSTTLALKGGFLLNRDRYLMFEDEQWALLAGVYTRARFEPGAFEESVTPGFSFGIGYRLPGRLRVAIAGRLERALDGDGVKIGPSGYFRWDPAPKWRLRMRGLGLQLEYRILPRLELFATGFRSSNRFRMKDRAGIGSGPTFRDRQFVVGGGFVVKILRELRFTAESGAVVDRRVSFKTRSDGTLDSNNAGETLPYFSFRFELRP
jgi:hypothetical protein